MGTNKIPCKYNVIVCNDLAPTVTLYSESQIIPNNHFSWSPKHVP